MEKNTTQTHKSMIECVSEKLIVKSEEYKILHYSNFEGGNKHVRT